MNSIKQLIRDMNSVFFARFNRNINLFKVIIVIQKRDVWLVNVAYKSNIGGNK